MIDGFVAATLSFVSLGQEPLIALAYLAFNFYKLNQYLISAVNSARH